MKSAKTNFSLSPRRHARKGSDTDVLALAAAVRDRRVASGLTQDQLALVAGVGRDTVMAFENGRGGISLSKAFRVLKALGLVVDVKARG